MIYQIISNREYRSQSNIFACSAQSSTIVDILFCSLHILFSWDDSHVSLRSVTMNKQKIK